MNNKKKVICLNTGDIFDSVLDASLSVGVSKQRISKCCLDKNGSAGKINNESALWMFYDDYDRCSDDEKFKLKNNKKIICINTKDVFNSVPEASKKYGVNHSSILKNLKGELKSAGKINGEPLKWMKYIDYSHSETYISKIRDELRKTHGYLLDNLEIEIKRINS